MSNELVWLSDAVKAIAKVSEIGEAKAIGDRAAAIKIIAAKQGWSTEQKARIAEIEVRADRRMGELLAEVKPQEGRPKKNGSHGEPFSPLATLGVSKKQSHRAQLAASLPLKG